jgi:RimJ/RimL family protein N-acetyltransferase
MLLAGILARTIGSAWSRIVIATERLDLVPATIESIRAALDGAVALSSALRARVPSTWPPEYLDDAALQFTIARLEEGPSAAGWWMYFAVLRGDPSTGRVLVGTGGFNGPPGPDGTAEVGYGIVSEYQRRGYATEAVRGMLAHVFAFPEVSRVIAETLPALDPSIGALRKCGFSLIGDGSEPGVIRFELTRASYGRSGGDRGSGTSGG